MNIEGIKYLEKDGELWFSFEKEEEGWKYKVSSRIPKRIQKKGEKAIIDYAERNLKKEIKGQKVLFQKHAEIAENPDFPVETNFKGNILRGKIISLKNKTVRVRMESPCQGEKVVNYGFGCTKSVLKRKDDGWVITKDAIESTKRLLTEIYKEESYYKENKEVVDLANKLNDISR